ncbi:MAG: hypothetical protein ACFFD6_02240 [Candidatus Thorarchaeota archaeon]
MRKWSKTPLLILLTLLISPSLAVAGYQGLEWAVQEGDTIDFQLKLRTAPRQQDYDQRTWTHVLDIYMEITELGNLSLSRPEMNLWGFTTFLLKSRAALQNGTYLSQLDNFGFYEGHIVRDRIHNTAAVPIGNWTLANSLVVEDDATRIDDETYWGYERGNETLGFFETWKWLKSDGTLSYARVDNGGHEVMTDFIVFDMIIQRSEDIRGPDLVVFGIVGVAIVLVAVVVFIKLRK